MTSSPCKSSFLGLSIVMPVEDWAFVSGLIYETILNTSQCSVKIVFGLQS